MVHLSRNTPYPPPRHCKPQGSPLEPTAKVWDQDLRLGFSKSPSLPDPREKTRDNVSGGLYWVEWSLPTGTNAHGCALSMKATVLHSWLTGVAERVVLAQICSLKELLREKRVVSRTTGDGASLETPEGCGYDSQVPACLLQRESYVGTRLFCCHQVRASLSVSIIYT